MPLCNPGNFLPTPPAFNCCPPEPPAQGCSAVWGSITGSIGNQLDLVEQFASKEYVGEELEQYVNRTTDQDIDGLKVFNQPIVSQRVQVGSAGDNASVIVGQYAFGFPTAVSQSTFVGAEAGTPISGSGGTSNTALGAGAGPLTGDLSLTTAIGFQAKATKNDQLVLGRSSLAETLINGDVVVPKTISVKDVLIDAPTDPDMFHNTAVGATAMQALTSGGDNTAVGYHALNSQAQGAYNTAFGSEAGLTMDQGESNTFIGASAGIGTSLGDGNTLVGAFTGGSSATGGQNTAVGYQSLGSVTTGELNTAVGAQAAQAITTGQLNVALGNQAGLAVTTGSGNTLLGAGAMVSGGALTNTIALGRSAEATKNGQAMIGGPFTTECYLRGALATSSKSIAMTSGNVTLNTSAGSVIMGSGATTLTVTNNLAKAHAVGNVGSVILLQMQGNDDTAVLDGYECDTDGSFRIIMRNAPTLPVRICFLLIN